MECNCPICVGEREERAAEALMQRYFVSIYTDGPATRWNVIDRQTQEWVRRFPSEQEAREYATLLETKGRP
jgi:hypothetical protein